MLHNDPVYPHPERHQHLIFFVLDRVHELSLDKRIAEADNRKLKKLWDWLTAYPYPKKDCDVSVVIDYSFGDEDFHESRIVSMGVTEEGFEVSHTQITSDKTCGSDWYSPCGYHIYPDGDYSEEGFDSYRLERTIKELISLGAKIVIEDEVENFP